jgi:hypothetical protein
LEHVLNIYELARGFSAESSYAFLKGMVR